MTPIAFKFLLTAGIMVAAMAAGYACRRLRWVREEAGESIMTFVGVIGYPAVGFLSVWGTPLHGSDLVLPVLAMVHTVALTFVGLGVSVWLTRDPRERGLFAVAGGLGNNGFTMGAFVLYLLRGEAGMGVANLYFLLFVLPVVLVMYPLARHYTTDPARRTSLGRLIGRSLWDWRSLGLPVTGLAIVLSLTGVPRPPQVVSWHLLEGLVYGLTPAAFFGIGLRLRGSRVLPLWRMLAGLAVVRFGLGGLLGLGLVWVAGFTPWPLVGLRREVFLVEAFVPTAVTMVAVANMFDLCPEEASVLFVGNTVMYLGLVLPVVLAVFG
jgi:predicted permease